MFLIMQLPPPTVKAREKYSEAFHDFLAKVLVKSPEDRPTASQLLKVTIPGN
jgi:serine/threonine protein kinase